MSKQALKVIAGTSDKPLIIGDIEIPCYVLEDETRVLSQRGFLRSIGKTDKTGGKKGSSDLADNIPPFLTANNLKPFIINGITSPTTPVLFRPPSGGIAYGYRAELLAEVCAIYIDARVQSALLPSQMHIAKRCDILMRGFARVGIIGLIDEATGYQEVRAQRALATILEKFIDKELQPWTKTFPYEFYEQIYRLKGWPGAKAPHRPSVIGHYTNDIVYSRLAPGVLDELKKLNPTLPQGHRRNRHHQWFTTDIGHPKLKEHLAAVTAFMRAAPNWGAFQRNLARAFPKTGETKPIPMDDPNED